MNAAARLILLVVALGLGGFAYLTGRADGKNACAAQRNASVVAWFREGERKAALADEIDRAAAARNAVRDAKLKETQHALKMATHDRPCLGGAALRLLDGATGLRAPAGATPAGALHGGAAGPPSDSQDAGDEESYATDTQVSGWIATAGDYYERCRELLRDIRRYENGAAR